MEAIVYLIELILMKKLNLYQIDAFTDHLFGGNPACVVPLNKWLDDNILLKIAKENAVKNQVLVSFLKKDILETTALKDKYDVMVSNPPYVRQLEKKAMKANVLDYEPGVALFVPNEDPLLFYRKIAQLAMVSLQTRGWLYFEINEYLSKEMDVLLKDIGFANIEIKKDFREVPRMIKCQKL